MIGELVSTGSNAGATDGSQVSLSDLAGGAIARIFESATKRAEDYISNKTRSSNTAPLPDVTAQAAKPPIDSTFTGATVAGVSLPILVLGAGALIYLIARK